MTNIVLTYSDLLIKKLLCEKLQIRKHKHSQKEEQLLCVFSEAIYKSYSHE